MTPDTGDASAVTETVSAVLTEYPVSVGILFGSRARGDAHERSDVDVAVAFDGLEPGDPGYNDALFGLGADLATALGTDDVDVVDLRTVSPDLVGTAMDEGELLVGTEGDLQELRERLLTDERDEGRSPAERFDDVLAAIDDHLA